MVKASKENLQMQQLSRKVWSERKVGPTVEGSIESGIFPGLEVKAC